LIEERSLIHDTKADTDACYDKIASNILQRSFDDVTGDRFPKVRLLLAGHNAASIRQATNLRKEMLRKGVNSGTLEFGQLLGMADHVSGELLAQCETAADSAELSVEEQRLQDAAKPHVFKCVNWGSVRECLGFLIRRAAENQGSTDRLLDGLEASKKELWARLLRQT
jgi:proline dehydrogenase